MSMAELYDKIMHNVRMARESFAEDVVNGEATEEEHEAFEHGLGVALQVIADVMSTEQEKAQN